MGYWEYAKTKWKEHEKRKQLHDSRKQRGEAQENAGALGFGVSVHLREKDRTAGYNEGRIWFFHQQKKETIRKPIPKAAWKVRF